MCPPEHGSKGNPVLDPPASQLGRQLTGGPKPSLVIVRETGGLSVGWPREAGCRRENMGLEHEKS